MINTIMLPPNSDIALVIIIIVVAVIVVVAPFVLLLDGVVGFVVETVVDDTFCLVVDDIEVEFDCCGLQADFAVSPPH